MNQEFLINSTVQGFQIISTVQGFQIISTIQGLQSITIFSPDYIPALKLSNTFVTHLHYDSGVSHSSSNGGSSDNGRSSIGSSDNG